MKRTPPPRFMMLLVTPTPLSSIIPPSEQDQTAAP